MPRIPLPLYAEDISAFARALAGQLKGQLPAAERVPSHLELLNMLARSSGFRNYQHLRAQREGLAQLVPPASAPQSDVPQAKVAQPDVPQVKVDAGRLKRLARLFDAEGRLSRWPSRRGLERSCLWAVWAKVPPRQVFTEAALKDVLDAAHTFGDNALLRRGLCDLGMMIRTPDGREYRRVEAPPTAEALALLELLRTRAI